MMSFMPAGLRLAGLEYVAHVAVAHLVRLGEHPFLLEHGIVPAVDHLADVALPDRARLAQHPSLLGRPGGARSGPRHERRAEQHAARQALKECDGHAAIVASPRDPQTHSRT